MSIFKKKRKAAIAFVDYEYWYYTYQNFLHIDTDPLAWRKELEKEYDLKDVMVFGDFSEPKIGAELPKLRTVTNTIVETGNTDSHRKKDMTDFIMLDYIYQTVNHRKNVDAIIIFTGDGHFQSVVKYISQTLKKTAVVYGIKDSFSRQLQLAATKVVTLPAEDVLQKSYSMMIISNFARIANKPNVIPTFRTVISAVSKRNSVPEESIRDALQKLIEDGYVCQEIKQMKSKQGMRNVKIVVPKWDKLIRDGYWTAN
ncbi:MAG: NYN domain-containing protein [Oscillospiraceae bacterium]|nr:NYN domain-containing protein [Oscillospiraceae bacterium]